MISLKYHSQKFFYINESLIMVKHANITNGTLKGLAITFELLMLNHTFFRFIPTFYSNCSRYCDI